MISCVSPEPDVPQPRPASLLSLVRSLAGELKIVIWKSHYTLTLYKGDRPVKTYRAVFGRGFRDGDKHRRGDQRTPEGRYYICTMNHSKRFYKFMGLSYPGVRQAEAGLHSGLISYRQYIAIRRAIAERQQPPWWTKLGGAIGIHGRMFAQSATDTNWTAGCIALNNADIDEIYSVATIGTPVVILP